MADNENDKNKVRLKVGELTSREEFGKGIARLDSQTMNGLGVSEGDIIEVEGKKKTGVIAVRSYPSDVGRNVIRMDGLVRKNAGTSLGEKVEVRKAEFEEANKVVLAPAQKGLIIQMPPQTLRNKVHMRPMSKGDIIVPTSITKGKRSGNNRRKNIFDEFFNMGMGDFSSFGSEARLAVVKTVPKGIVKITETTEVELKPQAVEIEEEKIPSVTYEDIGGLHEEIKKIREMIELPLKRPDVFRTLGMEPPKGVLLHGPPGTGKTLMAKAVANEAGAHFITLNGPEIMSKYYGESEKRLRELFEEAEENAPTIIFIDEIDAIASKRGETRGEVERRVVSTLLTEMDGLEARGEVIVIAATNRVDDIDPALRRPGRFDREIEIGVPDKNGREEILQIHTRQMPLDSVNLEEYSDITHGFVGADLEALTKEAGMHALRRVLPEISSLEEGEEIPEDVLNKLKVNENDFDHALKMVEPSAMREVLVEVPKINWEDIGGLKEQKDRLKEAVEWPLTKAEDFEEMGIEPTKGLLLYGPPGTGKTMLAKAVANESDANFISIRGPELLCVSGDTPIITSLCGLRSIREFFNLTKEQYGSKKVGNVEQVDLKGEVEVPSINEEGVKITTPVQGVFKLQVNDVYQLNFSNGNEMAVSANQPFYTYQNGSLEWRKTEELEEGNWIATPQQLSSISTSQEVPLPDYKHLRLMDEDENNYWVKIFSTSDSKVTKLPKGFTKELGAFLGWFVAEGNVSKEGISICNKKHKDEIKKLMEQFVPPKRITEYEKKVVVYSTPLVKYLESIFDQNFEDRTHTIKVPPELYKAPDEVKIEFLKAAWKGDGTVTKTKVEYASRSQDLISGMSYLLTDFGIKHKYWQRNDGMYMLTISGKKEMNKFKNIILKRSVSEEVRREYNAQYKIPDVSKILKKMKERYELRYEKELHEGTCESIISGRRRCGLIRLKRILTQIEKNIPNEAMNDEEYRTLKKIVEGNFRWTKVKKKREGEPQVMYDLETESGSFIGGELPTLLHNSKWVGESEKKVREVFKRAKQAAPTIIFFDEIDSLAGTRGRGVGENVSERVVSQLLTEMSGLEEMHDVVVIAATNRPDMVDNALLRPGRFDKQLYIPSPEEKARERIFEIHTRDIPLSDEVKLEKLAKKTENYSGADIQAVCKEAAMIVLRGDGDAKEVQMEHFEEALEEVGPSLTGEIIETYEDFNIEKNRSARNVNRDVEKGTPRYVG